MPAKDALAFDIGVRGGDKGDGEQKQSFFSTIFFKLGIFLLNCFVGLFIIWTRVFPLCYGVRKEQKQWQ